jgi:hypothetical protein
MLKAEKETILRRDSEERIWHIYSCHPSFWRRVERKGYKPVKQHFIKGREIARQYRVPQHCLRVVFRALDAPRRPAPVWLRKQEKPQKKGRKNKLAATR